ncbi:MAG: transcriptional regulator NrdR [Candidatus Firestonebacteria bacterium]
MKCPYCSYKEDKVIDSRTSKDAQAIRRRRECLKCARRFTTYEQIEEILPVVVKKDNRREPFDRNKILSGIRIACQKRPISLDAIERIVSDIEKEIQNRLEKEIPASEVGEMVVKRLRSLDEVAYVRFASVYRQFKDVSEFMSEVKRLLV